MANSGIIEKYLAFKASRRYSLDFFPLLFAEYAIDFVTNYLMIFYHAQIDNYCISDKVLGTCHDQVH